MSPSSAASMAWRASSPARNRSSKVAGCVARVDGSALIPISAVDINWTDHEGFFVQAPDAQASGCWSLFVQTIESVFGLKEADFEGTVPRTPRAREGRQNGRSCLGQHSAGAFT